VNNITLDKLLDIRKKPKRGVWGRMVGNIIENNMVTISGKIVSEAVLVMRFMVRILLLYIGSSKTERVY